MAVFMPINLPWESKSGPPEFPGLIAASVWITFVIGLPVGLRTSRPKPLITPCVSVWSNPKGLPTANTDAPTRRFDDVPTCAEQTRKINHSHGSEMDTSRVDGVKAPQDPLTSK